MTVPSPCNQVCTIDAATGWCDGCKRTIDEIAAWGALDDDAKRAVWAALPTRRRRNDVILSEAKDPGAGVGILRFAQDDAGGRSTS